MRVVPVVAPSGPGHETVGPSRPPRWGLDRVRRAFLQGLPEEVKGTALLRHARGLEPIPWSEEPCGLGDFVCATTRYGQR